MTASRYFQPVPRWKLLKWSFLFVACAMLVIGSTQVSGYSPRQEFQLVDEFLPQLRSYLTTHSRRKWSCNEQWWTGGSGAATAPESFSIEDNKFLRSHSVAYYMSVGQHTLRDPPHMDCIEAVFTAFSELLSIWGTFFSKFLRLTF